MSRRFPSFSIDVIKVVGNDEQTAILYIKSTGVCVCVCLSVRAVSEHCPDLCFFVFFGVFLFLFLFFFFMGFVFCVNYTAQTFVFFFWDRFCFLSQLNCPDLFFFFLWVLFSVSIKLPGPLFFFMGFVFCVS